MTDSLDRWCDWCGAKFRASPVGRRPLYCGRSCRQRAFEARRESRRIADAVAAAIEDERDGS